MTINNAEYDQWRIRRSLERELRGQAIMGTSSVAPGGSTTATASSAYKNQQGGDFKDELAIDAGFDLVTYDIYKFLANGDQGAPVTASMEQAVLEAATKATYKLSETMPVQAQLALMVAARKAHNNWRQRRQQLLTHAQMLAANRLEIDDDLRKMAAGIPLDGVDR